MWSCAERTFTAPPPHTYTQRQFQQNLANNGRHIELDAPSNPSPFSAAVNIISPPSLVPNAAVTSLSIRHRKRAAQQEKR